MKSNTNIKEGYKKTAVGIIPKDWEVKKLEEMCSLKSGGTPSRKEDKYWNGSIPWITTSLVNFNTIYEAEEFITADGLENSSAHVFPKGTTIMAIYGQGVTRGKVARLGIDASTNQACVAFLNDNTNFQNYLFYSLSFQYLKLRNLSNDGSQKNLSSSILKRYKLPIPPLPEQKAIANCLTTWDRGIEKLSALIKAKKEQKKGLMQQLLTGEKRLDGFEGEWEEVKLGDVAKIVMGVSPSSSNYNNEKHGMLLIQGNADIKNRISKPRQYTSEITKLCSVGDILMSVRAPVGEISKSIHNACIGRGICAIQNKKYADNNYLYYYLVYTEVLWNKFKQGSTFESVNTTDIKNFILTIPAIKEQTAIAEVLTTADKQIALLEKKLERFKEQKRGLMQVLLTGERRLS